MSKKLIVISGVLAVALTLMAAGGFFTYQYRKERAIAQAFARGTKAYENGNWERARTNLGIYIARQRRQIEQDALFDVLLKYSDACARVTENRLSMLMEAAGGYKELLVEDPENEEFLNLYLDALERRKYWPLVGTETENLMEDWIRLKRYL